MAVESKVLAGTGHRVFHPSREYSTLLQTLFTELKPTQVISGMALGFDQWLAKEALRVDIPVLAAVPFEGQESVWPLYLQREYHLLLDSIIDRGGTVHVVSDGGYSAAKMHIRNHWMVDRADAVVAYYNGGPGGTKAAVAYANQQGKPIFNLFVGQGAAPKS